MTQCNNIIIDVKIIFCVQFAFYLSPFRGHNGLDDEKAYRCDMPEMVVCCIQQSMKLAPIRYRRLIASTSITNPWMRSICETHCKLSSKLFMANHLFMLSLHINLIFPHVQESTSNAHTSTRTRAQARAVRWV